MPSTLCHDTDLLNHHPELKQHLHELLQIVDNAQGDVILADTAEERIVEQIRKIGRASMTAWAEEQTAQAATEADDVKKIRRAGKKNSIGTPL